MFWLEASEHLSVDFPQLVRRVDFVGGFGVGGVFEAEVSVRFVVVEVGVLLNERPPVFVACGGSLPFHARLQRLIHTLHDTLGCALVGNAVDLLNVKVLHSLVELGFELGSVVGLQNSERLGFVALLTVFASLLLLIGQAVVHAVEYLLHRLGDGFGFGGNQYLCPCSSCGNVHYHKDAFVLAERISTAYD